MHAGLNSKLFVIMLQLFAMYSHGSGTQFTSSDLSFVIMMHQEFCIRSQRCQIPEPPSPIINSNGSFFIPPIQPMPVPSPFPPPFSDGSCCRSCSCDLDRCALFGTCCPDTLDYLPSIEESASKTKSECNLASLKKYVELKTPRGLPVWMFTKCVDSFQGEPLTRQKCENADDFEEWQTKVPVVDKNTFDTFQNLYCALCNNIMREHIVYWKATIQCSKSVLIPSSVDEGFQKVSGVSDCNIIYDIPQIGMKRPDCDSVISQCNVTKSWKKYDPVVEAACHAYKAVYQFKYNNIFCFLCNEPVEKLLGICKESHGGAIPFSFSALLKFTEPSQLQSDPAETEGTARNCRDTQILDPLKNECLNLTCISPKIFHNGVCIDTVEYLTGIHYETFLKLTPIDTTIRVLDLDEIKPDIWSIYSDYFTGLNVLHLVYEQLLYYQQSQINESFIQCFVLHCKTLFGRFDNQSNGFVNNLLALEKKSKELVKGNTTFTMTLSYYDTSTLQNALKNSSFDHNQTSIIFLEDHSPPRHGELPDFIRSTKPILISMVLGCPVVELALKDYTAEDVGSEHLYLKEFDTILRPDKYVLKNASDENSVCICAEDFISMSKGHRENDTDPLTTRSLEGTVTAQGILSLVCTCISLVCLIITLVTYFLFKDLRTQPGINNMALVVCLIVAQAISQFGSNQAASVPEWSCQVIGILVHFFWLMVLFWMNVCCIHMCRVFASITLVSASKNVLKETMAYAAYTLIASTAFVLVNIIVSVTSSDFDGMGYGGSLCYITDHRMVGYVFAIPVGCVISVNLISFIIVVVKILRMPSVKSDTKHTRNYFAIYAKLSTLTGTTWIFGFIYFFTEVEAFEYVFIILNATQGVFIFVSFICNKRVSDMYRTKVQEMSSEQPSDSTSRKKSVDTALTELAATKDKLLVQKEKRYT